MRRIVSLTLLALTTVSLLSGCLVHKTKVNHIYRTTDKLHIYQPGEYINYYVTTLSYQDGATTPPITESGTLRIQWDLNDPLTRPGTSTPIPVVKETSILTINGSSKGLVRYISQDAAGQVTLHAVEDFSKQLDWLSATDITTSNPSGAYTVSYPVFYSDATAGIQFGPMPAISFHFMEGCSANDSTPLACDYDVAQYTDSMNVVGDTTTVTTNLGMFENPFQIDFSGNLTFSSTVPNASIPVYPDIRDICATGEPGSSIGHGTSVGDGTMYVMPQVGMIQMQNTCRELTGSGATTTNYVITISDTNIHL